MRGSVCIFISIYYNNNIYVYVQHNIKKIAVFLAHAFFSLYFYLFFHFFILEVIFFLMKKICRYKKNGIITKKNIF